MNFRRMKIGIWTAILLFVQLLSALPLSGQSSWNYVALGDSLAVGAIAFQGYVPRYRNYLQTDNQIAVSLVNLGQSGWWTTDLRDALTNPANPSYTTFRQLVANAYVITLDIGGNDIKSQRARYKRGPNTTVSPGPCGGADNQDCIRIGVAVMKDNWDAIIREIVALRGGHLTILRTMDIYNPYVNQDRNAYTMPGVNDFLLFKGYLEDVNRHIAETASRLSVSIQYARVYQKFNGPNGDIDPRTFGYISFDGLHPNDAGHKAIADQLRVLGYMP
jgi:lysophospholipase L1-like esterase